MAGPAPGRTLAFVDDPPHHWIRGTWDGMATRSPLPDDERGGADMDTVRLTAAQAIVRFLVAQRDRARRSRGAALPRGLRDLRPRQRDRARKRAPRGARRPAGVPRPERAGNGPRRGRIREGDEAAPDHGRVVVGRPGGDEHGDGGRRRDGEPPARAVPLRRHVPEPDPRPGAAAGRASRCPVDHGQRRLPRRDALLGPDRDAGAGRLEPPVGRRDDARSRPTAAPPFIGLPQDVQAEAYDYPTRLFEPASTSCAGSGPTGASSPRRPLCSAPPSARSSIAGGGVHYSLAESELREFAERHGIPVVETMAGKSCLTADHPALCRPGRRDRLRPCEPARRRGRRRARRRHRLQDFTTGSWTVFGEDTRIVALNVARFDATKHLSLPLVGDAREGLAELSAALEGWHVDARHGRRAPGQRRRPTVAFVAERTEAGSDGPPTYAQVVGAVNRLAHDHDLA